MINIKQTLLLSFLLISLSISSHTYSEIKKPNNIILILGSDNLPTLKQRVEIGVKLYNSNINFDYVIVSGGCGAHKSRICEATEMESILKDNGVPESKIIKEEKSQNTVQNYVYSRDLKKKDGTKYINEGDSLYVVSNHWHAISVAARFNTYDKVNAVYHIEGSIIPSKEDKVDYVNIFYKNENNEEFIQNALWPFVDASFSIINKNNKETTYLISNNSIFESSSGESKSFAPSNLTESLLSITDSTFRIDASFYNSQEDRLYIFNNANVIRYNLKSKSTDRGFPTSIQSLYKGIPNEWQHGYIDAALFIDQSRTTILFKDDECITISKNKRDNYTTAKIVDFFLNWPFQWSDGQIEAAHYNKLENKIYLFRGKEYIKTSVDGIVEEGYPKKIQSLLSDL